MPLHPSHLAITCLAVAVAFAPAADPARPGGTVHRVKVVADKAPDCSSLKAIVESVTRGCKSNDEKAIAIYNFMQVSNYHLNYPSEPKGVGALKEINVYGWSLCGGLHAVQSALWREMGWKCRFLGWPKVGHTTVEVYYDGRWHYLDAFLKFYAWMPDPKAPGGRTIAGEADLAANPSLVTDQFVLDRARQVYYQKDDKFEMRGGKANWTAPAFLTCGDQPRDVLKGVSQLQRSGSPTGWNIEFDSPDYSTDVDLAPGYSLNLGWDAVKGASWWGGRRYVPGHTCGDKDYRNSPVIGPIFEPYARSGGMRRSYANGTLRYAPDFADGASLKGLAAKDNVKLAAGKLVPANTDRPASITVALRSPYVMTRATGKAAGADKVEISLDGGKTFEPIDIKDFSEKVGGNYACLVKLSFAKELRTLELDAVVQCNVGALPYLSPGKNKITVSVADPKELGDNRLVVTYAFVAGSRTKSYEQLLDDGAEIGRAHNATWSGKPTVVQKVFTAKDLPATFDVDVPTPQGKYPVYPRMLFLRREVLAPGSAPLPLPEGAQKPDALTGELRTLPNPFAIGIAKPAGQKEEN